MRSASPPGIAPLRRSAVARVRFLVWGVKKNFKKEVAGHETVPQGVPQEEPARVRLASVRQGEVPLVLPGLHTEEGKEGKMHIGLDICGETAVFSLVGWCRWLVLGFSVVRRITDGKLLIVTHNRRRVSHGRSKGQF